MRHPHNATVRPLDEELAEMGLNPDKVLSEIDRNTAMLEGESPLLDPAGLPEGSEDVPRSLAQYGSTLLDEKKKCKKKEDDDEDDDDSDDDGPEGDEYEGMGEGQDPEPAPEPVSEDVIVEKEWIAKAIKDPGRVRKYLGVPEGEKIPMAKIEAAIEKLKGQPDSDEKKSLIGALVLAKRLKSGIGEDVTEDQISDLLYLIDEGWELDEAGLGIVKKARGAAARLAKRMRHRAYLKSRGAMKLAAKIYRKKFKRKIKRREKMKLRRFGREGLAKLHKMGKRVVQRVTGKKKKKEWADTIASLQEEMGVMEETFGIQEPIDEDIEEREYSPTVEALLNAAETAMYLGEVFDAMGDEAGQVLLKLSDKAVDLADVIEANENGEPTEEQEKHLDTVLDAVIKALGEYEDRGSPSLSEAIGMALVAEGVGTWDELVEYKIPTPAEMQARIAGGKKAHQKTGHRVPAGKTVSPDPTVAGKYLKAINMAMQKREPAAAMKAAEKVLKKHKVMDAKGLPVTRIDTMTDVLRTVFYLSQITGLKAPAWMYAGKKKPWFVAKGDDDQPGMAKTDAKLVGALKALGAPAGLLKAMGEEFEHVTDFVFSLEEAGMGAQSVVPGLDPDQERIFDTIVLMATNDGASYKKRDAKGAVKRAATQHKRDAASDLAFDLKKVEPYATKEVARRWAAA